MRPLALWGGLLALAIAYLGYSAERKARWLPFEQPIVAAAGSLLFPAKSGYDGTLASVTRQDVLIVQVGLYFLVATCAWGMAVRTALASKLPGARLMAIVLAVSALLRAEAVFVRPPLETDHYRYLWDGAVTGEGLNPYEFSPSEVTNYTRGRNREMYAPHRLERLERLSRLAARPELATAFAKINHPAIPTIYPPAAQALFAVAYWLSPGGVRTLKGLVALADFGVVLLLAALLGRLGRDPRWVIAYGWCPLILKEYAGTGHYDPLAVAFTLAALLWAIRGSVHAAGLALGAAALSKLYPLLLAPIFARRIGARGLAVLLLTLAAGYAPFASLGPRMFDGLVHFGTSWEFNSSLFAVIEVALRPAVDAADPVVLSLALSRKQSGEAVWLAEQTLDAFLAAKGVAALIVLAVMALAARAGTTSDEGLVARSGAVTATLLAVSPVADPWYFGWVAPFACVFPSAGAAWLAGSMALYYGYFLTWSYLWWARPLEYVPAYALLAWDGLRWRHSSTEGPK